MEEFVLNQIKYGLKYLPTNALASFFKKDTSEEVKQFKRKAGGNICGVCHPTDNYEQIKNANIGWIRIDIPFPFNKDSSVNEGFISFKEKCRRFNEQGIKVMAVTPYPRQFVEAGIDPVANENEVKRVAVYIINELRDVISAIQITNEMGMPHFTMPITLNEAVRFIGIQAQAMNPVKGNILVGYNTAGPQCDLHYKLKSFSEYIDYVGIDIYIGCFANVGGFMWFYDALLRYLWSFTQKPILLQEFGYIGLGAPKTKEERLNILRKYGANGMKDAKKNIEAFVSHLPEQMQKHIRKCSPDVSHQWEFLFKSDYVNHLFCELPRQTKIPGYPHTPEGQAKFYRDILPRLHSYDFLCGEFIYCYSDSKECYMCSQEECPTETKWGLVYVDGKEKPSYYAVKEGFGKILEAEAAKNDTVTEVKRCQLKNC